MYKRLLCILLTLVCVCTLAAPAAFAADTMQDSRFYSKQERSRTCTLASATMMLRRRAYLDGDENFADVVESSVRKKAWYNGLAHNFTYNGMTVGYGTLSGDWDSRKAQLIALLEEHPEGIVAYDRSRPHAILLTDYTDGVFYCADPADGTGYGRMPIDYASISLKNVRGYWYVASDANVPYGTMAVDELTLCGMFYPENVRTGATFNLGGTLRCAVEDTVTQVEVQILNPNGTIEQYAAIQPEEGCTEWDFRDLNKYVKFGELTEGTHYFYFVAKDSDGETISFVASFTVAPESTHTLYYWSNKPAEDAA